MTNLKDACMKVLNQVHDEYIHVVNEYDTAYEIVTVPIKGDPISTLSSPFCYAVDKDTGDVRLTNIVDDQFVGEYKQYSQSDLERLI